MSAILRATYVGTPSTTRGAPTFLNADPANENFIYPNGNNFVIRNFKEPLQADLYQGHFQPATVARFAPNGNYVASGDAVGVVRVWEAKGAEHTLKGEYRALAGPVMDLQWTSDSLRIAAVGDGKETFGRVMTWDSGNNVGDIAGHSKKVSTCDFRPTKPYKLVTGSEDLKVNWYEGPPFKFKSSTGEHTRFINCIRFSPDGSRIVSVGSDMKIIVYDGESGAVVGTLGKEGEIHKGSIMTCSWSPDSRFLLTASADKTTKIIDVATGKVVQTYTFNTKQTFEDMQVGCLWAGDFLLSLSLSGDVSYLDPKTQHPYTILQGHNKPIKTMVYDSPSKTAYTGGADGLINCWTLGAGTAVSVEGKGHTNSITSLALAPTPAPGSLLSTSLDDSLRITPLKTKQYGAEKVSVRAPFAVASLAADPSKILVATNSALVSVVNQRTMTETRVPFETAALAVSPNRSQVAVAASDNNVYLYNINTQGQLTAASTLQRHRIGVTVVSYSPDGKYLLSADQSKEVNIWDLPAGTLKHKDLTYHASRVTCGAWAPDSKTFATGSLDSNVIVWSVDDISKRIHIKPAHIGGLVNLAFVDAKTLLTAGMDLTLKQWHLAF